jgi:hypothetical protein
MGPTPDAQWLHRNVPGRAQSHMVIGPASAGMTTGWAGALGSPGPASAGPSGADPPPNAVGTGFVPQPSEAPTTTIVWNSRDAPLPMTLTATVPWPEDRASVTSAEVTQSRTFEHL